MVSYPPAGTRFGRCYTPCLSRQPVTPFVNPASDGDQDKSYLRWCCACRLHYPARRAAHFPSFLWCYRNHGFCLTSRLMAYCAPLTTSAFSAMHFPVTLSGALFYASCVLLSRFASGPFQRCSLPGLVISRYGDFIRPISAPVIAS